jgi:hypothetical protein
LFVVALTLTLSLPERGTRVASFSCGRRIEDEGAKERR